MIHDLVHNRVAGRVAPPLPPATTSTSNTHGPSASFRDVLNQQTPEPSAPPLHSMVHTRIAGRVASPLPPSTLPAATTRGTTPSNASPTNSTPSTPTTSTPTTGTPTPTNPATPQTPDPSPTPSQPTLHTIAALPNGGLMVNPTGMNALTGGTIAYNPNYYSTAQAAAQLAEQLGGTVVDLRGHISNNQSEYFINLPNGTTINAGNLLAILNNAVFQENSRVMDGQIATLLNNNAIGSTHPGVGLYTVLNGHVTYDPAANT